MGLASLNTESLCATIFGSTPGRSTAVQAKRSAFFLRVFSIAFSPALSIVVPICREWFGWPNGRGLVSPIGSILASLLTRGSRSSAWMVIAVCVFSMLLVVRGGYGSFKLAI